MSFFSKIFTVFRPRPTPPPWAGCPHAKPDKAFAVNIGGRKFQIRPDSICPDCVQPYFNSVGTTCAACLGMILPGEPVAKAWVGAKYPYTCMGWDCCESGVLYCGQWGEGKLITLHELDPEKYPAGTSSVVSHVMNSGQVVTENFPTKQE